MQILRHPQRVRSGDHACVATIGNFDGVHLGHQAIIRQLKRDAHALQLPAVVMTFEPQPLEFFARASAPPRLTSFREKCVELQREGVDRVICLRFSDALAQLSPAEFVDRLLVKALGVRRIVVGDDFRFGRNRDGDYRQLAELAHAHGFEVTGTETCELDGLRVSSSRIRTALQDGDMHTAAAMLGRSYAINGRIVAGDRRGRELGFATANIDLKGRTPPLRGVFAVRVTGLEPAPIDGVANLGRRPVFDGTRLLLEVHLFGFDRDVYGRRVDVEFHKRLRDEQRFESVAELKQQIARDCEQAQAFLRSGAAQAAR